MSTDAQSGGDLPTTGPDVADFERYRHIVLEDEELLVYDADDESAWVQSAHYADLEAWR